MKNKINPFDILVENLIKEFSKIPNFNLLNEDENGKTILAFNAVRFSELPALKGIYKNSFIPAINKAIVENKNNINRSKYKSLINITEEEQKELYFETIRNGYVSLNHKIENFHKELIALIENVLFSSILEIVEDFETFCKNEFGIEKIKKNWAKGNPYVEKINWIANSVKHCDGFPKEDRPNIFCSIYFYPSDKKIAIKADDFYKDIDQIQENYTQKLQVFMQIAQYRIWLESLKVIEDDNPKKKEMIDKMAEWKIFTIRNSLVLFGIKSNLSIDKQNE